MPLQVIGQDPQRPRGTRHLAQRLADARAAWVAMPAGVASRLHRPDANGRRIRVLDSIRVPDLQKPGARHSGGRKHSDGSTPGDLLLLVRLDDVAGLEVLEVRQPDAALEAGAHLGGVPVYRPTETRQWIVLLGKVVTGER